MIQENPHHYLERHAEEMVPFLDHQLEIHQTRVRRRLAVASGIIGVVAIAGLTALYVADVFSPDLPPNVQRATVLEQDVLSPKERLEAAWAHGSENERALARLRELAEAQEDGADSRAEMREHLLGFPFADLSLEHGHSTDMIEVMQAIVAAEAIEHRARIFGWLESPHADRRFRRIAQRCLDRLDSYGSGGAEAGDGTVKD